MYFHYPVPPTLWCDDSVCGDFSKLLGCVWYQSRVPSAFNRQSSKPSSPHFCKEAWGETEENLSVSNSIFLHNVLGLSGTCLINFIYSSDRQSYPPCFLYIHFIILFFFFSLLLPLQGLASEILLDVQEVKQHLMRRRRQRQVGAGAAKGSLSAKSMFRAKSIAASILNMSENDLADIMDTDQVRVSMSYRH